MRVYEHRVCIELETTKRNSRKVLRGRRRSQENRGETYGNSRNSIIPMFPLDRPHLRLGARMFMCFTLLPGHASALVSRRRLGGIRWASGMLRVSRGIERHNELEGAKCFEE